MIPKAGNSASARRFTKALPSDVAGGWTVTMKTIKAATRPMKLHGSDSRTASIAGASPKRRSGGTIRRSKKRLKLSDDGLDASDDLDIGSVDWLHRLILRLKPDAPGFFIEALHRRFTVEH